MYWPVVIPGSLAMLIGFPASRILSRLYYQNGGQSIWLLAWTAVSGWPITAIALLPFYLKRTASPTRLTTNLMLAYTLLGLFTAIDSLLFFWSYRYLPASTASLVSSSTLPFTAIFARLVLGKRISASTLNAIGVITAAAAILALDSNADKPAGVNNSQYALGFVLNAAGSALHGLMFTLSEQIFIKYVGRESVHVILEQQAIVSMIGFAFTTIGAVVTGDLSNVALEAKVFTKGSFSYYMVLLWSAITIQVAVLGSVAVMYSVSSVLAAVLNAIVVPITTSAAVICLNDPIDGFKVLSLILTGWGFGSYIYGKYNQSQSLASAAFSEPLY
ncbi:hypothetical protein KP509_16G035600 [Ceratopteris richardii]|uniref:Probable purine permease n=1 Tax=Ceratopteris richardii TaxID=49495 RepID=A0A8T2SXX1_CERRI|nr:hypothetical protein KP509_16G035600 [Ceratopteris richardii]